MSVETGDYGRLRSGPKPGRAAARPEVGAGEQSVPAGGHDTFRYPNRCKRGAVA